jgi:putative copper export protein
MSTYLLLIHILHVLCAVVWAGGIFMLQYFLLPAINKLGPEGGKVFNVFTNTHRFPLFMSIIGLCTILFGLLLLTELSDHFNSAWFGTHMGIAISIGATTGLGAFFIGVLYNKPAADGNTKIAAEIAKAGGPPTAEQMAQLMANKAKIVRGLQKMVWLMAISVICMAGARYF